MTIRAAVRHTTSYRYDRPVVLSPHVVRLHPAAHSVTRTARYTLSVLPREHFLHWQDDPLGNRVARLVFPNPTEQLRFEVELVADFEPTNPFDFFLEPGSTHVPFDYEPATRAALEPFLRAEPYGPRMATWIDWVRPKTEPTLDWLVETNRRVRERIEYVVRLEPGVQSPEQTLEVGRGSCRDSAWLLVQLLRHHRIAARFVSGYLIQLRHDVKPLEGPSGPEDDFVDLHAWAEAFVPGAGWIGLDPTSGLLAAEGHIPLACTPEPSLAAPVSGAHGPAEVEFEHTMTIARVHETARVTRPYEVSEWRAIDSLGAAVDVALEQHDVRLWMGGEPTFVSIDDVDSPEWTIAALGPRKRERAEVLFERLVETFAPCGLRHFGQGKWYPGESLPRWALTCHFRSDGVPLWRDPSLVAQPREDMPVPDERTVRSFGHSLARRLGVTSDHLTPAYEDVFYYLWRERKLPINVTTQDNRLASEEERARIARIFEQGLGTIVGFALPLRASRSGDDLFFESAPFRLRPHDLFLIPGDSPMGYRLPLDSFPWLAPEEIPFVPDPDPFARQPSIHVGRRSGEHRAIDAEAPRPGDVRTALCLEVREDMLHVFMPPMPDAPAYFALVSAVEETAAELDVPLRIEGYPPPFDARVRHFSVTPDPGVIEVNIHPAVSWAELGQTTRTLYAIARECRLGTEKFLIDGRHVGTGGGNHMTLGGPSPADSPLLRRPHLLRSLVAYWLDHPSLSYLFSGLFVGPTSQAPRVDEARHESLRELEIAFDELERQGTDAPPWLVDRLFRHLLADATGNTHRTEFCIDKLYDPSGPAGRRGILELRAFEMPPHPEMGLVQALLVRALVATFWEHPYRGQRLRHGTSLHDRFLLPHFVRRDFHEVLSDLRVMGYPFREAWFESHLEFRFPRIATINRDGLELELRMALEPWNVLGEEGTVGGTARFVDSSLERIEVVLRNAIEGRHGVLCNRRPLPLAGTGTRGESVAGVRYRAWQPPSCLHPTIGVHAPLTFEIVDGARGRSLGGLVYHVVHPDGRAYEQMPVNAEEASGRRRARVVFFGHTPGELAIPAARIDPEMPFTLDLRRPGPIATERAPEDRRELEALRSSIAHYRVSTAGEPA